MLAAAATKSLLHALSTQGHVLGHQQSTHGEILVQLRPVDTDTAAHESPVTQSIRAGVAQLGEPLWISVDPLLALFGLSRRTLNDPQSVLEAVRTLAARLPTYITIKEVKRRWGHAQEDIFPVTQFEKLWGDMTSLPEASTEFFLVPRQRGQQLKEVAHLDGWDRDGSRRFIESLCEFV